MLEWIVKYWLEVLFGGIAATLLWSYRRVAKKMRERAAEDVAIKEGLLAILHDRIYDACRRCIAEGEVSVEELRNIESLYNAYHALGGNGTGTELYNRACGLRIKTEGRDAT